MANDITKESIRQDLDIFEIVGGQCWFHKRIDEFNKKL